MANLGSGDFRLPALLLLASLVAGTEGCALPIRPGCGPEENLPGEDPFLTVATIATDLASSIYLDRTGRSYFSPDYTAWMLSTTAVCRTIAAEDLLALEKVWQPLAHDRGDPRTEKPEWPYLLVVYHADDERPVVFSVKPGGAWQKPHLQNAVELTLAVFERTYGDRFVRELRGAGLQDLLLEAP